MDMDGKPPNPSDHCEEEEAAAMDSDWELLNHHHSDESPLHHDLGPHLDSALIRPDYFSLDPLLPSSNSSSSSTDPSEVDRNFDDSFLANQLFPLSNHHLPSPSSTSSSHLNPLSNDSDSDSDAKLLLLPETASTELLDSKQGENEPHDKDAQIERGPDGDDERGVWWKVPFEVFKYWVVRVSPLPAWSLSVAAAAAFVGLFILGRRLYRMKRKTQTLKLNVALDDKKVSQLMGRVARLNEAFSVVKRVPIIRPSLPAPSVTLRPVMSMR